MKKVEMITTTEDTGMRVDTYLADKIKDYSRSQIQDLIKQGRLTINGQIAKANYRLSSGELLVLSIPVISSPVLKPENIELDIIYEDNDIIVINKAQGMLVHPHQDELGGSLVNALLYRYNDLSSIAGHYRPGIVHRIDKDTSGLLVVAKNNVSHSLLAKQLADRTMTRVYLAIVEKVVKNDSDSIDAPIGRHPIIRTRMAIVDSGRRAITNYKVIERFKNHTLVELSLVTGRTHQIRVHMKHIGHPVVGDPIYGSANRSFKSLKGQALHAYRLSFIHPTTKKEMTFVAPPPLYFEGIIDVLRKQV